MAPFRTFALCSLALSACSNGSKSTVDTNLPTTTLDTSVADLASDVATDSEAASDGAPHDSIADAGTIQVTLGTTVTTLVGDNVLSAAAGSVPSPNGLATLRYFPDEGTSIVAQSASSISVILAGGIDTWLLTGADLNHLTTATRVLAPTAGSWDNGYVGMSAVLQETDGTLYGFYHGEDHTNLPNLPGTTIPGFYARIGLASSTDNGATWSKLGYVIEDHLPKNTNADSGTFYADQGAAEPGAVFSADGQYVYLYYTDHSRDGRPVCECMARALRSQWPPTTATLQTVFEKYTTGVNYFVAGGTGTFTGAAIGGPESPIMANPVNSDLLEGHVTYSATLGRYIMVLTREDWTDPQTSPTPVNSGLSIAYSVDGLHWDPPVRIIDQWAQPIGPYPVSWEATILWNPGSDTQGTLVYGYSPQWGFPPNGTPHYMVSRAIAFSKN